jgi:hypothetical protein
MQTDRENTFANSILVAATGVVGDVVKVNNSHKNINLNLYAQVQTAFNNLTSLAFEFWYGPNADGSGSTTIASSGAIPLATLNAAAGYRFTAALPDMPATTTYVGLRATPVGTPPTLGAIASGIAEVVTPDQGARPLGFTGY